MILSCPSCRARYVVPDSAIGTGGRKVRCVKCRFSWYQEGPDASLAPGEPSAPASAPAAEPGQAPAYDAEAAPPPDISEVETAPQQWEEPEAEPEPEPELHDEIPEPRARRSRMWPIIVVVAALLMVGAAAAIYFIGWPQINQRLGLAADSGERLAITGRVSREQLPTNTELLTVTGEIRNLTDEAQRVPQIRADLLDAGGQIVYSWAIAPPRAQIQARETITFNSASTDAPSGGQSLSLSFAPLT